MSVNGKILTRNTERADWPREKLLVCLHDCAYDSMLAFGICQVICEERAI